ncbi:MAG: 16S rRNA (adenine(1518)-N(6)/adenine(1519)-N(6))-dimethyltransferase RsmA [Candidatus Velthaea sp.]
MGGVRSWCTSSNSPKALLAAYGLRPKKRLGQHFLMDGGTAARIARLAVERPGERVVEIGAGTGALTAALVAAGAAVTAFDVDAQMVGVLRSRDDIGSARIECADALAFDYAAWAGTAPWTAAGNLPYNIATPLMLRLAELPHPPQRVVAMIQKDVAQRLTAKPGTASYGSLTVAIAHKMSVRRAFSVGPAQFFPRPNVDSAVVVLQPHTVPPVVPADPALFAAVVRGAFAYRRKTLANSLAIALSIPRDRIANVLRGLHLNPEIRGEELDLATFAALADALAG